jgi:hypothetical protein
MMRRNIAKRAAAAVALIAGMAATSPVAAGVGTTLLFWGDAAVRYPFGSGPLLRTDELNEKQYRVTGKLSLVNTSSSWLDVSCTTQLNIGSNIEHVSVPPTRDSVTGRLTLLMEFVAPSGTTVETRRAELNCTCASGTACNSLSFENLGIIAEVVADDSGNKQVPSAPSS